MKRLLLLIIISISLLMACQSEPIAPQLPTTATEAQAPTGAVDDVANEPENTSSPAASDEPTVETEATDDHGHSHGHSHSHEHVDPCSAFMDNTVTRCEDDTLIVESDGLPTTHNMMIGIVSWQQQFPLPQPYTGNNAWQIPLSPVLADEPISGATDLFRGAVALAVNGVPIFNALNNRGVDAYLAGELDEWGGHVGRGDDYHYHTAPTHLQDMIGIDQPIAYALDGFPIYGLTEPDGSEVVGLDEFNGHFDDDGNYHYHATETYPYINGGMRGEVTYENGQVEPQPAAQPVRPAGDPLQGATITDFVQTGPNAYSLKYTLNGDTYTVNYAIEDGVYTFEFIDPAGNSTVETYTAGTDNAGESPQGGDQPPPPQGGGDRPPQEGGGAPPPQDGGNRQPPQDGSRGGAAVSTVAPIVVDGTGFELTSSDMQDGGSLPVIYTCDGASMTPPLAWENAPVGTVSYALLMDHQPPGGGYHWYWVAYDIAAEISSIDAGATVPGTLGTNSVNGQQAYAPPCSRGPGEKLYSFHVYALSATPDIPDSATADRDTFLNALDGIVLATADLDVVFDR